ncbi:DWNN domain-containing protein [Ditylenchus destructor]|uniref:DWNN domain-containing protein n=1 Tax=Ditylenchus destructor TaxID=166010 RepID=A0AAD4RB96_9BILA|nr:DWNN domain-containing protein [Ditylenchus destructor]
MDLLVAELAKCRNELTETLKSLSEKNNQLKDSKKKFSQVKALAIKYRDSCAQHEKTIESLQFDLKRQREESISSAINANNGSGTSSVVQTVNSTSSGLEQVIMENKILTEKLDGAVRENQILTERINSLKTEMTVKDVKFRDLELRLGNALAGYQMSAKRSRKTNKLRTSSNSVHNYEHCERIPTVSSGMVSSQVTHPKSPCHRPNYQENAVRAAESDNDTNPNNAMTVEFCTNNIVGIDESLKRSHELSVSQGSHDSRTLNDEPALKVASTEIASTTVPVSNSFFGGVFKPWEFYITKPSFIIGNSSCGCKESSFESSRKEMDLPNKNSTNKKSSMFGGSKEPGTMPNFPWFSNNVIGIIPTSKEQTSFAGPTSSHVINTKSSIRYKFRATRKYKALPFDGLHISVEDLKRLIYDKENIRMESFDLILANAHTQQQYANEELVPMNSSVVVHMIPQENALKLPKVQDPTTSEIVMRKSQAMHERGHIQTDELSKMTEEERSAHVKDASTWKFNPENLPKKTTSIMSGPPPPTYVCNRCSQPGHWFKNCPALSSRKSRKRHPTKPDDKGSSSCTAKDSFEINATKSALFSTTNVSNNAPFTPVLFNKLLQSTPFGSVKPQTSILDTMSSKNHALVCSISHKTKAFDSAPTATKMPIFGGSKSNLSDTSFAILANNSTNSCFSTSARPISFGDPKDFQLFSQKSGSPEKSSIECKFLEAVVKANNEVSNNVIFPVNSTIMEDPAHESVKLEKESKTSNQFKLSRLTH